MSGNEPPSLAVHNVHGNSCIVLHVKIDAEEILEELSCRGGERLDIHEGRGLPSNHRHARKSALHYITIWRIEPCIIGVPDLGMTVIYGRSVGELANLAESEELVEMCIATTLVLASYLSCCALATGAAPLSSPAYRHFHCRCLRSCRCPLVVPHLVTSLVFTSTAFHPY